MALRAYTESENRTGRSRLEKALFSTVLLAQAMFCYADDNGMLMLASVAAMGGHWLAAHWHREIHVRRTLINAVVLVLGIALVWRYLAGDQMLLVALGQYVMLIQICKLFERKGIRDYVQMIVMSMLLVLASAMMAQELLFAVMFVTYLVLMSRTAMALTVKRSLDVAESGAAHRQGPAEAWPTRAIAARLAVVATAMLVTAAGAFLVVPRGLGPRAGSISGQTGPSSTSAFADTVRLGQRRNIYFSDRIVIRMRMTTGSGANYAPAATTYLRGKSFERYYDSRWESPEPGLLRALPVEQRSLVSQCVSQDITMVPSLLPMTFTTYPALAVAAEGATVTRLRDHEYELKFLGGYEDRPVRYEAKVLPGGHPARASIGEPDDGRGARSWRGSTQVGPDVPAQVIDLARQWCGDLPARRDAASPGAARDELDLAIASRIAEMLEESYEYTLDLTGANPARDGVEDFLFHLKRGHCEYFASALTVMCQGLGVRARLSTGFAGGEYDSQAGTYTFRQRNAHAWTEIYTARTGWLIVDATPADRFEPTDTSAPGRIYTWLRNLWSDWEFTWFSTVVGYNDEDRRELAGYLRSQLAGLGQWARQVARDVWQGLIELFAKGRLNPAAAWFFVCVAAAALLTAALAYLWRIRPRIRRGLRLAPAPKPPAFMARLIKLLARHAAPLTPCLTVRQWALRAVETLHLPAAEVDALIDLHERIRWSGRAAGRDELDQAEARVRRLRDFLST